jgi:negative regulator of flagellin synthesis FlgM
MVEGFKSGLGPGGLLGLGSGGPREAGADQGGVARPGAPRASKLPAPAGTIVPPPVAASLPAGEAAEAAPRARGIEAGGLVRELAAAPPVDSARVAELKMKIASGAYRPDPERIASAMIASELPPNSTN